jgi:hypothetical protein
MSDDEINVSYTNWRGETSVRRVLLSKIRFGTTEWHPEPTWLISAFDLDHPSKLWKEFDLTKCDFDRSRADLPPTAAQIMADPRVKALVADIERLNAACDAMWNDFDRVEKNNSPLAGKPFRIREYHCKAITEAQQRLPTALAAIKEPKP